MNNVLNSICSVNLYTELATVIPLAVVGFFFKSSIQMCITAIIIINFYIYMRLIFISVYYTSFPFSTLYTLYL